MTKQKVIGWLLFIGSVVLGWRAISSGFHAGDNTDEIVYAGGVVPVGAADGASFVPDAGAGASPIPLPIHDPATAAPWVTITDVTGPGVLTLTRSGVQTARTRLQIIAPYNAILVGLAVVCLMFGLPLVIGMKRPWPDLIAEPGGGLSLAKTQLLLWFVVAFVIIAGLSLPLHALPEVTSSLAMLLALGGITTVVGAVTSPPLTLGDEGDAPALATVANPASPAASAKDLVTDWNDQPDISRYQYLLIAIVGATAVLLSYASRLAAPEIPTSFYYLLAASQATYLGTKAVKSATPPPVVAKPSLAVRGALTSGE